VAPLLMAIDGYAGSFVVKCALQLAPLLFVRPGELRQAEWAEVDLELAEWTIPAEKMKMRQPHLVPLSAQAIAILKELHALTGRGTFLREPRCDTLPGSCIASCVLTNKNMMIL
jgi:integrase